MIGAIAAAGAVTARAQQTASPAPASTAPTPTPMAPAAMAGPSPMSTPGMTYPLAANPHPTEFDAGPLGTVYLTGVISGVALTQNHVFPGDAANRTDMSNGQVFVQKTSGVVQFFLQAGEYSLPDLGLPYVRAADTMNALFGPLPQAFVKFVPMDNFSISVGKLPTLVGAEYTFSFENTNIERGLLWNQENAVNRGVQANYTSGPVTVAVAVNDGYYSKHYNWVWLSVADTIDSSNSISFIAGGSTRRTTVSTSATPLLWNNSQIYNLIYTHTAGPWTIEPYVQYNSVPASETIGTAKSASTLGAALFVNYTFDAKSPLADFSLAARAEWIRSSGNATDGSPNLLYGPGSKAWSFTITPTYQHKAFFIRGEFSYVKATDLTPGLGFGQHGTRDSQVRLVAETGIIF